MHAPRHNSNSFDKYHRPLWWCSEYSLWCCHFSRWSINNYLLSCWIYLCLPVDTHTHAHIQHRENPVRVDTALPLQQYCCCLSNTKWLRTAREGGRIYCRHFIEYVLSHHGEGNISGTPCHPSLLLLENTCGDVWTLFLGVEQGLPSNDGGTGRGGGGAYSAYFFLITCLHTSAVRSLTTVFRKEGAIHITQAVVS